MTYIKEDFNIGDLIIFESFDAIKPHYEGIIRDYKMNNFTDEITIFIIDDEKFRIFAYRIVKIIRKKENPEYFV